jgi:hypothetical protein
MKCNTNRTKECTMNRHRGVVWSRSRGRNLQAQRPGVETLDRRLLLHAGGGLDNLLDVDGGPALDQLAAEHDLGTFPAIEAPVGAGTTGTTTTTSTPTGLAPLSSIPVLNSLLGASASLYLDFDGHFEPQWGGYSNVTSPAFDQDGDATTFSVAELGAIDQIWQFVAEDYAPFNINVTTVLPPSFADGVAMRVAIGGTGAWTGGLYGGLTYVNTFTNWIVNTSFVFPKNLANGYARYTADAVSHEAGHAFGLQHQSQYSGTTKVADYYAGPGDGRAPLMGYSYGAARSLWWYGTSIYSTIFQDDLAVLSRVQNRFGYRADDHGNTATTATPLAVSGTQVGGAGIIEKTSDLDVFSVTTGAGTISLTVDVPAGINNLDARLELRDATGTALIASAAPSTSFGATVTATVAAGSYRLVVASQGNYGDVGQYTVRGTIVPPILPVDDPAGLSASGVSATQVNLSWTDRATNETGYRIERSADGTTWVTIATTFADATAYADTTVAAGTAYQYRVLAFNNQTISGVSNVAGVTTVPEAPSGLSATAVSPGQIDLSWGDVGGAAGFRIERSTDGITWTLVGTTGTHVAAFQDTGLDADTTYRYRVAATNAGGASAPSDAITVTTPQATSGAPGFGNPSGAEVLFATDDPSPAAPHPVRAAHATPSVGTATRSSDDVAHATVVDQVLAEWTPWESATRRLKRKAG